MNPHSVSLASRPTALVLLLLLAACGGGGGGGGDDGTLFVAVGAGGFDGTIQLDTQANCEIDAVTPFIRVGESEKPGIFTTYWAFVTFDISGLPAGATILSATANVRLGEVVGDNVFAPGFFGNVVMEHVDIGPFLSAPDDMTTPSLSGQLVGGNATPTFLAENANLEFKSADIKAEVERDIADGRTRTTLRLSCQVTQATDGDLAEDEARFFPFDPADTTNQERPFLVIRFSEP